MDSDSSLEGGGHLRARYRFNKVELMMASFSLVSLQVMTGGAICAVELMQRMQLW